ncbi:MAG: transglutaminase [Henriciella sp.]|uniref:transglutaminase-like domain-containing protein n=1 Tax=Henriciella sp. TaxID=1968823 RepID=UPI000C0CBB70|nr:transglutaminase family protein [Henriciella sp.]MAN74315.1 transglutaminase [Henriciella sp.]MBF34528.1 transglutaminase [Hyphomonadaceae bacterium]PHR83156.1 MAG: transglutaminase [Henriciella sp.]
MRVTIDAQLDYRFPRECDVLLALRARPGSDQYVAEERLSSTGQSRLLDVRYATQNDRRNWMVAEGEVSIRYTASVEVSRAPLALHGRSVPRRPRLPASVIGYLMPSHYSAGAALENFAWSQFGHLHGGDQVVAMIDWIRNAFTYAPGASNAKTTAADTFASRAGVCRDYSHVLISFCRAVGIPARMVSAYAPGLNPPDFHAVVDVWLDGDWHIVDPTGMAPPEKLVRIICGRDAADISFMTIFGEAELISQSVSARDEKAVEYAA